jgi:hypothetical protein
MKMLALSLVFLSFFFLLNSCQVEKPKVQIEPIVEKYVSVWNGGSLDSLDSIVADNFEIRNGPTFESKIGREALKKYITETRTAFPDFIVSGKQITLLGDTALVALWSISGTYYNPEKPNVIVQKTSSPGFSVIFFSDNKLTGEWIAYSDLNWYKGMGYELTIPNKK